MKVLRKKNFFELCSGLKYSFKDYQNFIWDDDNKSGWGGFSVQQRDEVPQTQRLRDKVQLPAQFDQMVQSYSAFIMEIIEYFNFKNVVITRDYNRWGWVSNGCESRLAKYLSSHGVSTASQGAILLMDSEIECVIPLLVEFPYRYQRADINIMCRDANFVVRITHHFTVDIYSEDKQAIEIICKIANQYNWCKMVKFFEN